MIFYIGFSVICVMLFAMALLALKTNKLLYRTFGLTLFFISGASVLFYAANLVGGARNETIQMLALDEELNKVIVLKYALSLEDNKIIYLWILPPDSEVPLYWVIENASKKTRRELYEKTEEAEEAGTNVVIYLKGKEIEAQEDEGGDEESSKGNDNASGDEEHYRVELLETEESRQRARAKTPPADDGIEVPNWSVPSTGSNSRFGGRSPGGYGGGRE